MAKTNFKPTPEETKIEEGKKAGKVANKKAAKKKLDKEAKKLAEKAVIEIAAALPAGEATSFLQDHAEHQKAEESIAAAQKWKRTVRARMKTKKIDMSCYDRVNKLFKMDKDDMLAKKATEARYEKQLGLALSPDQQQIVTGIEAKRENARAAMSELSDGATGKEVGSGNNPIGHNSGKRTPAEIAAETIALREAVSGVPEKNEKIGSAARHLHHPTDKDLPHPARIYQ